MLCQDQGLLLGQGHQPFGVSQLCVLGLGVCMLQFSDKIDAGLQCQKPQEINENGLCLY